MALQDYYNTGDNDFRQFFGAIWNGQTFTASSNYSLNAIKILVYRVFTPDTITVSIRATSGNLPTGSDLATETFDGDGLTSDSAGEWKEVVFEPELELTSGVKYALIVRAVDASFRWRVDDSAPTYTGGTRVSSLDSGSSWDTTFADDFMFEIYGTAAPLTPPTKAENPAPTDTNASVTLDQATITWDDGGGADTYNVYYGTSSGDLSLVSAAQAGESFIVTDITDGSPFEYLSSRFWRIDSTNGDGTTTGDEWSFTTIRLKPPGKTYFYTITGQYYKLLVQSDGSLGDPPGMGVENTDYVFLAAGYEANFVATNRRLVAAAENRIWYEDI